jgi:hypothetical protein
MNKKGKTLKAYLCVVFMLIGNGVKAQMIKSFKGVNGFRSFRGYLKSTTGKIARFFLRTITGFVLLFNKQVLIYFPS